MEKLYTDMEERNDEMMELIVRSLRGDLSVFETSLLHEWCSESSANRAQYEQISKIWKQSLEVSSDFEPNTDMAWQNVLKQIDPKGAVQGDDSEQEEAIIIPMGKNPFTAWRIAAAVAVLVGLGLAMQFFANSPKEYVFFKSIEEKTEFVLPDKSHIWLNKNSQLTFVEGFADGTRTVSLSGEAFFDVKKSTTAPFTVIGNRSLTKVMGTSFRIRSYTESAWDEIDVMTGKVLFASKKDTTTIRSFLLPGDHATVDKTSKLQTSKTTNPNAMAWNTGTLIFDQMALGQVLVTLEQFYGVTIKTDDNALLSQKFTGTFDNVPVEDAMKVLSVTFSLNCIKSDNQITFTRKN